MSRGTPTWVSHVQFLNWLFGFEHGILHLCSFGVPSILLHQSWATRTQTNGKYRQSLLHIHYIDELHRMLLDHASAYLRLNSFCYSRELKVSVA